MARTASGGRHGLAQGIFQVGGQTGGAIGPLLAAFVIVPLGHRSLSWFSIAALVAMGLMAWIAGRYAAMAPTRPETAAPVSRAPATAPARAVVLPLVILIVLLFSKSAYSQSFTSFLPTIGLLAWFLPRVRDA